MTVSQPGIACSAPPSSARGIPVEDGAAKSFTIGHLEQDRALVYFANSYYGMAIADDIAGRLVPGPSPAVDWLGYATWNDPKRRARRDTLRAFAEVGAEQGMATFERYERMHPELDMDNLASFLSWVLEGRELHDGRALILGWQIQQNSENVDAYLNLAQSHRALGEVELAVDTLREARTHAEGEVVGFIDAQLGWLEDDVLVAQQDGSATEPDRTLILGNYDSWRVFDKEGTLLFQPGSSNQYQLTWMHGTTYALEELEWFRLRFELDGDQASKVIGRYSDGRTAESLRTNP